MRVGVRKVSPKLLPSVKSGYYPVKGAVINDFSYQTKPIAVDTLTCQSDRDVPNCT
jgi:hypothetical protein